MILYRAWATFNEIRAIEVEGETANFVTVKGSRHRDKKRPVDPGFYSWFKTWDEAKAHIVAYHEARLRRAQDAVVREMENVAEALALLPATDRNTDSDVALDINTKATPSKEVA